MDFGKILSRAWDIIWKHKYLILLGVIVALSTGGGYTPNLNSSFNPGSSGQPQSGQGGFGNFSDWENANPDEIEAQLEELAAIFGIGMAVLLTVFCVIFFIVFVLWILAIIARGALIAGVDGIERGEEMSFGKAWGEGWNKFWRLLGVTLVTVIPAILLFTMIVFALFGFGFSADSLSEDALAANIVITLCTFLCIGVVMGWFIKLLMQLAYRAAVIEDTGVFESYGHAWEVLRTNIGPFFILLMIQFAISIAISFVMFIPGIIIAFCCFLWPVAWLINGAVNTYFSTVWTLAWREATDMPSTPRTGPAADVGNSDPLVLG